MGTFRFSWAPGGPVTRLIWKAAVPQGHYEVDHSTLAARFVRTSPAPAVEPMSEAFTTLEEAQRHCEQHWQRVVRDRSDTSSRRRPADPSRH